MKMTQRYLYYLEGVLVTLATLALVPARLEAATQDRHTLQTDDTEMVNSSNGPESCRSPT